MTVTSIPTHADVSESRDHGSRESCLFFVQLCQVGQGLELLGTSASCLQNRGIRVFSAGVVFVRTKCNRFRESKLKSCVNTSWGLLCAECSLSHLANPKANGRAHIPIPQMTTGSEALSFFLGLLVRRVGHILVNPRCQWWKGGLCSTRSRPLVESLRPTLRGVEGDSWLKREGYESPGPEFGIS